MKRQAFRIISAALAAVTVAAAFAGCKPGDTAETDDGGGTVTVVDNITIPDGYAVFTADMSSPVDPPLLKKIAMYNAGCIMPLSNYDRDMERIKELNAESLRIDLSIGKNNGTGGGMLVSDDYEITDYDAKTGKFKVDPSSLKYDFSQLDGIVSKISATGTLPYMSWCYIPYPLQENGKWNDLDQNITNWRQVWEQVHYNYAKHYKDIGVKIGYHEIYNEPDLEILKCWGVFDANFDGFLNWNDFCLGSKCAPGEGVYPDMYEYGAKGILKADPDATIGGPAFALGEIGVEGWVGFLPRVIEKKLPLDFYSFHSYLDGNTWFMSDAERAAGSQNEIEKVAAGLGSDPYFLKTSIHINEYNYLNDKTGSNNGLNSSYNYSTGASKTLDAIMEIVERTTVQWVSWAQFMESTGGYDPYGLIEQTNGHIKALFNAIKIYNDMPVSRFTISSGRENGVSSLVSAEDGKISVLLWNTDDTVKQVGVNIKNAGYENGVRRVYRIDSQHASWFDNNDKEELEAEEVARVSTDGDIWYGEIPAYGVVYITLNQNGEKDFDSFEKRTSDFADAVKVQYYYEDRFRGIKGCRDAWEDYSEGIRGSYSHFDRNTWTMYLGMGDCEGYGKAQRYFGQGRANGAVTAEGLPESFEISLQTIGELKQINENTTLGVRFDFYDKNSGKYTKSVYFHNGLYNESRDPNAQDPRLSGLPDYPWGTEAKADTAVGLDGTVWNIKLSDYAPSGWQTGDRVMISFDMQNTGRNTEAVFRLYK